MKLLISCPRKILHLDAENGELAQVESGRGEYYGVSWSPDGTTLCISHSGCDNSTLMTLESYMESESGWVSVGSRNGPLSLSAPHQILCGERHVLIANTGRNALTLLRYDDLFYRHYWFDDVRWDRKGREYTCGRHFNSLFQHDDRLWLLAHNFSRGSQLLELAWPELELIKTWPTNAYEAHNIWVADDGGIILCDTKRAAIIELKSRQRLWTADDPNVRTRGLASDGTYVFVGCSQHANRMERVTGDGGIWVLDARTWQQLEFVPLPNSGNVNEIRILDGVDLCHHGRPFQGTLGDCLWVTKPTLPLTEITVLNGPPENEAAQTDWVEHAIPFRKAGKGVRAPGMSLSTLENSCTIAVNCVAQVELEDAEAKHVGITFCYHGPEDSNQLVAMLARVGSKYALQLWYHDGESWSCLHSVPSPDRKGRMALNVDQQMIRVQLDNVARLTWRLPADVSAGSVGLRTNGGTVWQFTVDPTPGPCLFSSDRAA